MPGSGGLRSRVAFQRATFTRDAYGDEVKAWATFAAPLIEAREASASESYRAAEVAAEISSRLRVRFTSTLATLNPADRAVMGGVVHEITGVRVKKRRSTRRWLEVDVVARDDIAAEEAP